MDKFKAVLKHKWTLPSVYLFILVLLVMFAGPYFAFADYVPLASLISRIAVCSLIAIGFVLYHYIVHLKKQSQQDELVDAISTASQDDASDAISAESKALKAKFVSAFEVLKKTKGGKTSLIELPWYMIIGSPGSGKTTLLSNSGLNFPLAEQLKTKHLEGIGGTKNCDWWISNEAVLLDTAGRYTSQDSYQAVDQSGWFNFLNLIKRYRKKPISGLMVSISMADVLSMNEYELSQMVKQLKQRISEVNQHFNAQFPVYIILTKSDMLAGFTQFFDSFSHQEREQAFGLTFAGGTDHSTDSDSDSDIGLEFEEKFSALLKSIDRRQWNRMSMERDAGKKATIYSFSDQIASLQTTLKSIVYLLSNNDHGPAQSLEEDLQPGKIRGVYFTSGTQSGAPIDRMVTRISQAFGLRHTQQALWNNDQRSYFIKDLLQQLMFVEADRFGTLTAYEHKKKRVKQSMIAACALCSLVFCVGLYSSFSNNTEYLERAQIAVDKWRERYANQQNVEGSVPSNTQALAANVEARLPALNAFVDVMSGLSVFQSTHFAGLGLAQESSVDNALSASYDRLLQTVLVPYILEEMSAQMRDSSNPVLQYQALKSYLMLSNPERLEQHYLRSYLLSHMNKNAAFSAQTFAQLQTHLIGLLESNVVANDQYSQSVEIARAALSAQPLDEIYYQQFRNGFLSDKSKYLSLAQIAGSNWRSVFEIDANDIQTLSTFYTPETYTQLTENGIDAFLEEVTQEAWVLGPQAVVNTQGMDKKFEDLYAQDYTNQWQSLLNAISVKQSGDLASLLTTLPILSESTNPIFELLNSVAIATNIGAISLPVGNETKAGQNLSGRLNSGFGQIQQAINADSGAFFIKQRFSKLHELMTPEKKLSTEQRLKSIVQEIQIALNLQTKNIQAVSNPASLSALEGFALLQVAPLNRWLDELHGSIKIGQSQIRKTQLSNLWEQSISGQCKAIVNSTYPFELAATKDASLDDLRNMFAQNGAVFSFFNTHLAPMVDTNTTPWRWKNNIQKQYGFANQVLPFFEKSAQIQKALFTSSPNKAALQYTFTPVYLDPKLSQIRLSIFGTNMAYQFGRPVPQNVQWPPTNLERNSEVIFIRRDGSEVTLAEKGLFAFAKLIEQGQNKRIANDKVQVTFSKSNFKAIYEISITDGSDPLLLTSLSNYKCLSNL